MLNWLRNLTRRQPPPPPRRPAPRRSRPHAPVAAKAPPVTVAPVPIAVPCDPARIAAAAEQVRAHFHENHPGPGSFPGVAARIIDAIQQKEPDFNKLVQLVGQDAAIAARLLHVASSAAYGDGSQIHDVRAAALRLGLREVGEIALGVAGRSLFRSDARAQHALFRDRWDALFHESMTAAFVAGTLSFATPAGQADRAFLAGMLHDVGRSIALRAVAALRLAGQLDDEVFVTGVDDVVDAVHVEIGASMAAAWSLPEYLRLAIADHHDVEVPAAGERVELHLARIADGLAAASAGREAVHLAASAAALRIGEPRLRVAQTEYVELAEKVTRVFSVAAPRRG